MTTLIFVHGYSVTNLDTYGGLPLRLQAEAARNGIELDIKQIFLGRYISFKDEVGLYDISRALDTAINEQIDKGQRFICITHSTGGPLVRDWWNRFYENKTPPISHLIMLAPANFGSTLAKLGKGTLSRLKSWFDNVEPGQLVLNWLQLGSEESWNLNKKWIINGGSQIGPEGIFPFVIIGQSINRKLYDNLNSYTGELGSDGVIRTSAANLNSRYIKLMQESTLNETNQQILISDSLKVTEYQESVQTPLRVVAGKSHSGDEMGIMKSVKKEITDENSRETVNAIFECIKTSNMAEFNQLIKKFDEETNKVQQDELVEVDSEFFIAKRYFIHDRFAQVIFKLTDSEGYPVMDYDLMITGEDHDPNHLPAGFAIDRQQNSNNPETITYYFNYDIMVGAPKNEYRDETPGIKSLGLIIKPRPSEGFVRFVPCEIVANNDLLNKALKPNSTTLIEIILQRVVSKEVFRMEKTDGNDISKIFKDTDWDQNGILG